MRAAAAAEEVAEETAAAVAEEAAEDAAAALAASRSVRSAQLARIPRYIPKRRLRVPAGTSGRPND